MDIKKVDREDVVWIYLAHSKVQWRTLVNMVINFLVKENVS
jgi:hypothetical protein